jgi:hypothetical protein
MTQLGVWCFDHIWRMTFFLLKVAANHNFTASQPYSLILLGLSGTHTVSSVSNHQWPTITRNDCHKTQNPVETRGVQRNYSEAANLASDCALASFLWTLFLSLKSSKCKKSKATPTSAKGRDPSFVTPCYALFSVSQTIFKQCEKIKLQLWKIPLNTQPLQLYPRSQGAAA